MNNLNYKLTRTA